MPTVTKTITADLCPSKPDPKVLDLGDTKVTVTVTIDSKSPLPSSKVDRCVAAGNQEVTRCAQTISQEIKVLEGKVRELAKKNDSEGAQKMASATSASVQNAIKALQGRVNTAVQERLRKEAQGDRNLLEARAATVVRTAFKAVGIANKVFDLIATGGTDILAWIKLVKKIYSLVNTIYEASKGEEQLRAALLKKMGAYFTDKQRQVIGEEKADRTAKQNVTRFAKTIYGKVKSKADAAEKARKKYRNEVTSIRQSVDSMFTNIAALETKVKKAGSLKEGVQIGAKLMVVKRRGRAANDVYQNCERFADDMAMLLTEAGVKVDDATFTQKMASLKHPGEMLSVVREIVKDVKSIEKLIENIRGGP
ncbi:hypothetical protein [Chondromyces crocatus]|uniref:Uncharacterized protein n=1 Tax=Chondromyces crocatus TaxID=52 RepID=A0A0K1ERU0_CHOCO|nr:hypothetical protein [Chondromyces crocatus]AKT43561.1 uncharacterized protein CMC5_077930 [Chondromyces crocatus]